MIFIEVQVGDNPERWYMLAIASECGMQHHSAQQSLVSICCLGFQ